jgi:hypothetical protein
MFQYMENTCCTNHNSQTILYETSSIENVAYTCFKQQLHDEMDDAHVYEMENAICGSQTPRVIHTAPATGAAAITGLGQFVRARPALVYVAVS